MKTISGVKSNVDVWEWGALDSKCWNCVVNWVEFIHFNCTWTFLRGTYFLFPQELVPYLCAPLGRIWPILNVCALFLYLCAHLGRIWLTLYLLFVCAFRKDLAHFVLCALLLYLCMHLGRILITLYLCAHLGRIWFTLGLRQASSHSVKLDKSVSDYSVLGQAFLQNLFSVLERSFLQKTIVLGFICHISLIIIELGWHISSF